MRKRGRTMDEQKIIEAFHMMWDNFPEPVMLIQQNRQIYAVNRKAEELGINDAMKCTSIGTPEQHRSCLCNLAVKEKRTTCRIYEGMQGQAYGYWMPVAGAEEYILHFGVGNFSTSDE